MAKYRRARAPKILGPYHRKKREETRRKRELKKLCHSTVQNIKGSSKYITSDIDGQPNSISEKINENCANCASNFEHENERNVKLKTFKTDKNTNEMEIIDAIFYIYGLTVADWSKTLTLEDHESDFSSVSEIVFSNGIVFCSKCTTALENVYTSHKRLKELAHFESLFSKALNKKYSCEIENKIECDDENEESSLNNSNLSNEESEFKEEDNSEDINMPMFEFQDSFLEVNFESDQLDDPLMVDGLHDLKSSSNITCNESEKSCEKTVAAKNKNNNITLPEVLCKTNYTLRSNTLQRHRHSANTERSINNCNLSAVYKPNAEPSKSKRKNRKVNKTLSRNGVPQKEKRVTRKQTISPPPESTILNHPFNILCCDESFISKELFVNHRIESHSKDVETPTLVKCNICEILIPEDTVDNHMVSFFIHLWKKYFKCQTCDSQFKSAKELTEHLQTHDPKYGTLICDICEIPMQSDLQLIAHKKKNHPESGSSKQVTCNLCGKLVSSLKNLQCHMKRMHLDTLDYKYICMKCNMKFSSQYFLELHRTKLPNCHIPNQSTICEKCGKNVITKRMYRHMRQHEDIECPNKELFRCSQCGKMLKHSDSLTKHMRREHPEKEKLFFCEKCGKTTKNMTNMRIHMKVHEKE